RLHLPFPLLSDAKLALASALGLPTFDVEIDGHLRTLLRRLTMILTDGTITEVFYPVFPPDADAERVIAWLRQHPVSSCGRPTRPGAARNAAECGRIVPGARRAGE